MEPLLIIATLFITYYTGSYGAFLWKKKQKKASVGVFIHVLACIFVVAAFIMSQ
jgi:hypothetical protein